MTYVVMPGRIENPIVESAFNNEFLGPVAIGDIEDQDVLIELDDECARMLNVLPLQIEAMRRAIGVQLDKAQLSFFESMAA